MHTFNQLTSENTRVCDYGHLHSRILVEGLLEDIQSNFIQWVGGVVNRCPVVAGKQSMTKKAAFKRRYQDKSMPKLPTD